MDYPIYRDAAGLPSYSPPPMHRPSSSIAQAYKVGRHKSADGGGLVPHDSQLMPSGAVPVARPSTAVPEHFQRGQTYNEARYYDHKRHHIDGTGVMHGNQQPAYAPYTDHQQARPPFDGGHLPAVRRPSYADDTVDNRSRVAENDMLSLVHAQHAQIERQQHMLVVKEQRLKYMRQQELHHQHVARAEFAKLRKLRQKVEAQDERLRRYAQPRIGHVDGNNRAMTTAVMLDRRGRKCSGTVVESVESGHVRSELASIRSLFVEREKELAMAVDKVDDLRHQVFALRNTKHDNVEAAADVNNNKGNNFRQQQDNQQPPPVSKAARQQRRALAQELDRLRRELAYRRALNAEEERTIRDQRDQISNSQAEVIRTENRIAELQSWLTRKRAADATAITAGPQSQAQTNNGPPPPAVVTSVTSITGDQVSSQVGRQPLPPPTSISSVPTATPASNASTARILPAVVAPNGAVGGGNLIAPTTTKPPRPVSTVEPFGRQQPTSPVAVVSRLIASTASSSAATTTSLPSTSTVMSWATPTTTAATLNGTTASKVSTFVSHLESNVSNGQAARLMPPLPLGGQRPVLPPKPTLLANPAPVTQSTPSVVTTSSGSTTSLPADSSIAGSKIYANSTSDVLQVGGSTTPTLTPVVTPGQPVTATENDVTPTDLEIDNTTKTEESLGNGVDNAIGTVVKHDVDAEPSTLPAPRSTVQTATAAVNKDQESGEAAKEAPEKEIDECATAVVTSTDRHSQDDDDDDDDEDDLLDMFGRIIVTDSVTGSQVMMTSAEVAKAAAAAEQVRLRKYVVPDVVYDSTVLYPGSHPAVAPKSILVSSSSSTSSSDSKTPLPQTAAASIAVSFDPLALLLDAALEGELDLVEVTARQVADPSAANDEGITALHNAICAGHAHIVRFLVHFGCDVNAEDADGWTPLHCAASCNNLPVVKFLVEHGAALFAATHSDQETAAEKCEEGEDGFLSCSDYLLSVQRQMVSGVDASVGVSSCNPATVLATSSTVNGSGDGDKASESCEATVYALYDYSAAEADELSFVSGDAFRVVRAGDSLESDWWFVRKCEAELASDVTNANSSDNPSEGYVPVNYLGLYPRIQGCRDGSPEHDCPPLVVAASPVASLHDDIPHADDDSAVADDDGDVSGAGDVNNAKGSTDQVGDEHNVVADIPTSSGKPVTLTPKHVDVSLDFVQSASGVNSRTDETLTSAATAARQHNQLTNGAGNGSSSSNGGAVASPTMDPAVSQYSNILVAPALQN